MNVRNLKEYIHQGEIAWRNMSRLQKLKMISDIHKMDMAAVSRLKMVGKHLVRQEDCDQKDLKYFYELMDAWLIEFTGSPGGDLKYYEKGALIQYGMDIMR